MYKSLEKTKYKKFDYKNLLDEYVASANTEKDFESEDANSEQITANLGKTIVLNTSAGKNGDGSAGLNPEICEIEKYDKNKIQLQPKTVKTKIEIKENSLSCDTLRKVRRKIVFNSNDFHPYAATERQKLGKDFKFKCSIGRGPLLQQEPQRTLTTNSIGNNFAQSDEIVKSNKPKSAAENIGLFHNTKKSLISFLNTASDAEQKNDIKASLSTNANLLQGSITAGNKALSRNSSLDKSPLIGGNTNFNTHLNLLQNPFSTGITTSLNAITATEREKLGKNVASRYSIGKSLLLQQEPHSTLTNSIGSNFAQSDEIVKSNEHAAAGNKALSSNSSLDKSSLIGGNTNLNTPSNLLQNYFSTGITTLNAIPNSTQYSFTNGNMAVNTIPNLVINSLAAGNSTLNNSLDAINLAQNLNNNNALMNLILNANNCGANTLNFSNLNGFNGLFAYNNSNTPNYALVNAQNGAGNVISPFLLPQSGNLNREYLGYEQNGANAVFASAMGFNPYLSAMGLPTNTGFSLLGGANLGNVQSLNLNGGLNMLPMLNNSSINSIGTALQNNESFGLKNPESITDTNVFKYK